MSKMNEDIGFQGFESTAADLDEAIAFLKETLASPISCRHTIDGTSYTPVHARNVLGVSAMMAAQSIPPSSVQHRSPYTDACLPRLQLSLSFLSLMHPDLQVAAACPLQTVSSVCTSKQTHDGKCDGPTELYWSTITFGRCIEDLDCTVYLGVATFKREGGMLVSLLYYGLIR